MGLLWKIIVGLIFGGTAAVVTGTGGFFELTFSGLLDDAAMIFIKQKVQNAAEFGAWESLAFTVAIDELRKLLRALEDEDEQKAREDRLRGNFVSFRVGVEPSVYGQFDLADAGLLWLSADTVLSSDTVASLAGVLGEAAVVL